MMKHPITVKLDAAAAGKILASHFANTLGMPGPWRVVWTTEDNVVKEVSVTVSEAAALGASAGENGKL